MDGIHRKKNYKLLFEQAAFKKRNELEKFVLFNTMKYFQDQNVPKHDKVGRLFVARD